MLFNKRGQSTSEFAITVGVVVALAAGVLGVALKGGIRTQNKRALNYLTDAGSETLTGDDESVALFSQDYRMTKILAEEDFTDQVVLDKGGAEKRYQKQKTESEAVSVELIDAASSEE